MILNLQFNLESCVSIDNTRSKCTLQPIKIIRGNTGKKGLGQSRISGRPFVIKTFAHSSVYFLHVVVWCKTFINF